ncbi:MAG TPA: hypothetical protein VHM25_22055 [Polyangiaceae bacterium]|jgi:hypothetical protein|nr:hypothetical protein [Polyangiaceae bacterium]
MSSAVKPGSSNAPIVVLSLCAGLALGWLVVPRGASAFDYAYSVVSPAGLGATCVYAFRRGGRAAGWVPLLVLGWFLLDIARKPHVPALSALGVAAAVIAGIASLRGHQRATIVGAVVSCTLLAATLIGGRWIH